MQSSILIPTYNRPKDLNRCLTSIAQLTTQPLEVIVIEQGDVLATQNVIDKHPTISVSLLYHSTLSGPQARNKGIENASGELLFFIDDDVQLPSNYLDVAIDFFEKNPKVVGLTGQVINLYDKNRSYFSHFFKRINFLKGYLIQQIALNSYVSFNMKIWRTGGNSSFFKFLRKRRHDDIQWMSGGHMTLRRSVFEYGFAFNNNFLRRGFGEDVMLTYQLYKHYGKGSLCFLPDFQTQHFDSNEISSSHNSVIRMMIIYRFIFWHSEVYQGSIFNLICYLYSQWGFARSVFHVQKKGIKAIFDSYCYLFKNWDSIANSTIDYNSFILGDDQIG